MINIRNLCKTYYPKKGVPVKALDGVSLDLEEKGMVFVLGKSGSGKSTFLNVLGGLDKYDSGEIIIKGKSSRSFSQGDFDSYRNTFIGFIFQEYNILEQFSVAKNIALALELQGKKGDERTVEAIMEQVDLKGYAKRKPNELSGGQKQRVAIARALIKEPDIIMADEPTGALDSNTGKQVFDTLKKLSKNKLVIVVSHDREFAEIYGDRIIEFSDGKIISDTKKYYAPPKESGGITITDDKILQIKAGHKLTEDDARVLNGFLAAAQSDTIISIDPKSNDDFKKVARIDGEGNKESFAGTGAVKTKEYRPGDFKLIRSRLPYRDSFKIGASGLKAKPARLFFTILLSAVAFTLFGLADTLGAYNKVEATLTSLNQTGVTQAVLQKNVEYEYDSYGGGRSYKSTGMANMNDDDIKKLNEKLTDYTFKPAFGDGFSINGTYDYQGNYGYYSYYTSNLTCFYEMDNAEASRLGYMLKAGAFPVNDDEIAVSEYIYSHYADNKYVDPVTGNKIAINNYGDFIGKTIIGFKVTGIVDTGFNTERYKEFKEDAGTSGIGTMLLGSEFQTIKEYGLHCAAFVRNGYYKDVYKETKSFLQDDRYISFYPEGTKFDKHGGFSVAVSGAETRCSGAYTPSLKDDIIWYNGVQKTALADNEMIVSAELMAGILQNIGSGVAPMAVKIWSVPSIDWSTAETRCIELIEGYAQANYAAVKTAFEQAVDDSIFSFSKDWQGYAEYVKSCTFNGNVFDEGKDYNYFYKQAQLEILSPYLGSVYALNYYSETARDNITADVRVVGIYKGELPKDRYGDSQINFALFSETVAKGIAGNQGDYRFAVAALTRNRASDRKLVKFTYAGADEDGVFYSLKNEVSYALETANDLIETLAKVFLYVGIGFAVFAALLLMNFISTSISYKKREIGVLRAVGARSGDVFGIFFNESLIIALINFLIAVTAAFAVSIVLNGVLRNRVGILVTLLSFGIRQIALVLGASVFTAFIASFLPVSRIARKRPIDAIQNR